MVRLLVALLLLSAFCLGAAVSYYNWHPVAFNYLAGEVELPLIALLLLSFTCGLLVMWLLSVARMFLMGRETRRQASRVQELEAELKNLRSLPLAGAKPPTPPPASMKNAG